jgi:UDP-GlcNAc:undecaprenyl-phosphate GlcNAc-1-phosphate transferase
VFYISFFLGGILISLISNKLLLNFSSSLGIRNKNDVTIRWSNQSKPSLGGVSFYVVFLFTFIVYSIFSSEFILHNDKFIGLLLAGSIAFTMGLADDAYNTKPWAKLFVQILCGIILVYSNSKIELTHDNTIDSILTVLWVIVLMNSLNMLDNMDGITGITVVFILISSLFSMFMLKGIEFNFYTIINISILGSVIGFLYYNINPSKLFMGDAGSQFIGLFVAFISIHDLWNLGLTTNTPSWVGVVICLIAFTPAAADTLTVVINRIKKGKSPMVGGKDHTTHHLVYFGLKDKQVWYVFLILGMLSSTLSIWMIHLSTKQNLLPILFLSFFFPIVFGVLFYFTLKYKAPIENENNK